VLSGWWGKFLLLVLSGVFVIGLLSSWQGSFLPPLAKAGKHIRQASKHYKGGRPYRGIGPGGGIGSGK